MNRYSVGEGVKWTEMKREKDMRMEKQRMNIKDGDGVGDGVG